MTRKPFRTTLSDQERTALEYIAELEGLAMSAVLRRLLLEEAERRGVWPPIEQETAIGGGENDGKE